MIKIAENKINELTMRQEKDVFVIKRVIEDEMDAEEFLRTMTTMDAQIQATNEQVKKMKKDYDKFDTLKKAAQKVRSDEIKQGKKDIKKEIKKEEEANK